MKTAREIKLRVILRSIVMTVALFSCTMVMCVLMLWTLALPRRSILGVVHLWFRQLAWIERVIGGIDYRVVGRQNIPAGACIIAAKHQSAWETFKLHLLFGDPAIVLKQELLSIPVWGWYLRRSAIPIDRTRRSQALSVMVPAAQKAKAEGRKIVIFPQGTRVSVGAKRPYKSGVAVLYEQLQLPVVPMALNSGLFWSKNSFIKKPGTITIEFLPPIQSGLPYQELMAKLELELEAASDRLAANPESFADEGRRM